MRILLLTVAGLSTRFRTSVGKDCLKCIYYKNNAEDSLIYQMLARHTLFDKVVIVGGYKYDELKNFIDTKCEADFSNIDNKLIFVYNDKYDTYGSGYSLYLGLDAVIHYKWDDLIFAEGDLFVDDLSFNKIVESTKSVITFNYIPIEVRKAVIYYFDSNNKLHYIYDTGHNEISIPESFKSVYNSGQIWKFHRADVLIDILSSMNIYEHYGANLNVINKYFNSLNAAEYEMIGIRQWINCNIIDDYTEMEQLKLR